MKMVHLVRSAVILAAISSLHGGVTTTGDFIIDEGGSMLLGFTQPFRQPDGSGTILVNEGSSSTRPGFVVAGESVMTVQGAGSLIRAVQTGSLIAGNIGIRGAAAYLNVLDGGTVQVSDPWSTAGISISTSSTGGHIFVSGMDSRIIANNIRLAAGTLTVQNGGSVSVSGTGTLGTLGSESQSSTLLTGSGTQWNGTIWLGSSGGFGFHTLTIEHGARLNGAVWGQGQHLVTVNAGEVSGFLTANNAIIENGGQVHGGSSIRDLSMSGSDSIIFGHSTVTTGGTWNVSDQAQIISDTFLDVNGQLNLSQSIADARWTQVHNGGRLAMSKSTISGQSMSGRNGEINLLVSGNGMIDVFYFELVDSQLTISAEPRLPAGIYIPIVANTWEEIRSDVSVFGGLWNSETKTFVVSGVQRGGLSNQSAAGVRLGINNMVVAFSGNAGTGSFEAQELDSINLPGEILLAAYQFTTDIDSEAMLSFDIEGAFNKDDFRIWYRSDLDPTWVAYNPTDLSYDGQWLNFTVAGFSSYAVTVVPEPSTVALLVLAGAGVLLLSRRRKPIKQN